MIRARCVTCQRFVPTGERYCLDCVITERPDERDDWDEAYERAAARARDNDFEETGGKDWT